MYAEDTMLYVSIDKLETNNRNMVINETLDMSILARNMVINETLDKVDNLVFLNELILILKDTCYFNS